MNIFQVDSAVAILDKSQLSRFVRRISNKRDGGGENKVSSAVDYGNVRVWTVIILFNGQLGLKWTD